MLLLKRHLVELVRRGLKRQTIRLWSRPLLRANSISYTPGLGKMKITAVDQLPSLAALTEQDAIADGFPNLRALLDEIHRIYGHSIPANRHVYRIQFKWPIDPAGKTLILPKSPVKSQISTPKPKSPNLKPQISNLKSPSTKPAPKNRNTKMGNRRSGMSTAQRHSLRNFIVSKNPH